MEEALWRQLSSKRNKEGLEELVLSDFEKECGSVYAS